MAEGGGGALRELLVAFGFSFDTDGLNELGERIAGVKEKVTEFAELLGGGFVGEKVREFLEGQVQAGMALKRNSDMLGVGTDALQRFQLAAEESGASTEDASTGLRFLVRNIGDAASGTSEAAQSFARLGVAVRDAHGDVRPTMEVLGDLSDGLMKLPSQAERSAAAVKIFGRGGVTLLPMLADGKEGLDKLSASFDELGGGMNEGFIQKAEEAEKAQVKLNFAFKGVKSLIAGQLLPGVTSLVEKMTSWAAMALHAAKATGALKAIMAIFKTAASTAGVFGVVKGLSLLRQGVMAVITAFGPFTIPILLVAALIAAFQDLWVGMNGGKSTIFDLLDAYNGVGTSTKLAQELRDVWQEVTDLWKEDGPLIEDFLVSTLKSAFDLAGGVVRGLMATYHYAAAIAKLATGDEKGSNEEFNAGDRAMKKAINDVAEAFGAEPTPPGKKAAPLPPGMKPGWTPVVPGKKGAAAPAPPPDPAQAGWNTVPFTPPATMSVHKGGAGAPASVVNNNNFKSDVTVTTGSGDPKKIAGAVSDGMADGVQRHLRNGVAAKGGGG